MAKGTQVSVNMRKIPKQQRSKFTIEAILDATAQLLGSGPASSISTNHIARRAGISIGTLYQYFPNKTAVLLALADRGRRSRATKVLQRLATLEADTIEDVTLQIVRILIEVFADSRSDRQLTLLMNIQRMEGPRDSLPIDRVASAIASKLDSFPNIPEQQSEMKSFVLTRAIMGTIRSTVLDAPHLLKTEEFENQLVLLVTGFLEGQ
jgi:AcrR family transcriptional regulator